MRRLILAAQTAPWRYRGLMTVMLGTWLRRDPVRLGLSICQAAVAAGIWPARLRLIEEGEMPDGDAYDKLAEFYGWPQTVLAAALTGWVTLQVTLVSSRSVPNRPVPSVS